MSKKDFDDVVELLGPQVTSNVEKITPKDLKVPLLFRLDEKIPRELIPRMPKSAGYTENQTVPRVVTATTIFGCMTGHAAMLYLLLDRRYDEGGNNHYKLTAYEFEHALLPNNKLVYDASDSQEAWLITYNKETLSYRPIHYGELFFHKVSVIVQGNSILNKKFAEFLIHVTDQRGVQFSEGHFLEKGYYYVKADVSSYALGSAKGIPKRMSIRDNDKFNITPITATVYKSFRDISVTKKG